jgi:hypothetical protein
VRLSYATCSDVFGCLGPIERKAITASLP